MQEITFNTQLNLKVLEKEVVVSSQEEYKTAGDILKLCKNKIKEIDEERKEMTRPLDESKKKIMAKAKEITEPLTDYIRKIEKAMSSWFLEEEKKRQEEQKRLEQEAIEKAGDNPDIEVAVVEDVKTQKGNVATSTAIKYNDYEIEDESLIPREYLMPNESKIKLAVKNGEKIKGIKIIQKVRITSR